MAELKTTNDPSLALSFFQEELRGAVELKDVLPGNIPGYSITESQTSILVPSNAFNFSLSNYVKLEQMQLAALEYGCELSEVGSGPLGSIRIAADKAIPDLNVRNQRLASAIKSLVNHFGQNLEDGAPDVKLKTATVPFLRPLDFITFLRPDSGLAMSTLTIIKESTAYEHNYETLGYAGVRISTNIRPGDDRIPQLTSAAAENGYSLELVDNRSRLHEIHSKDMGIPVVQDRSRRALLEGFDNIHDTEDLYHFHLTTKFPQRDRNSRLWDFVKFVNANWPELRG